jgi:hypothetical protein
MMREGQITPMDSVPSAVERQDVGAPEPGRRLFVGLVTIVAALVLLSFIGVMVTIQFAGSRVEGESQPERALALIVGRTMDIDEAVGRAPSWEQRVYHVLSTDPAEDLQEGIRWYEELSAVSFDSTVDLHLAILEGESGRMDSVQRRTEEWKGRPDPLPAFAILVGAAYLDDELADEMVPSISEALAEVLEPGWFRDRIATRLAVRVGDRDLLAATTAAQEARSTRLFARTRATLAVEVVLIVFALVLLVRVAVRRRAFDRISAVVRPAMLAPPRTRRNPRAHLGWGDQRPAPLRVVLRARTTVFPRAARRDHEPVLRAAHLPRLAFLDPTVGSNVT